MKGLHPYLNFNGNCKEAMEFYANNLGGKVIFSMTFSEMPEPAPAGMEDKIMHMSVELGEGMHLLASDCPPGQEVKFGSNITLSLTPDSIADLERMFNALAQGGKVIMPVEETFWAERFGMLVDKFGIYWMLNIDKPKPE